MVMPRSESGIPDLLSLRRFLADPFPRVFPEPASSNRWSRTSALSRVEAIPTFWSNTFGAWADGFSCVLFLQFLQLLDLCRSSLHGTNSESTGLGPGSGPGASWGPARDPGPAPGVPAPLGP